MSFKPKNPVPQIASQVPTNGRWLTGLPWPKGYTGKGLSPKHQGLTDVQLQKGKPTFLRSETNILHTKAVWLVSSTR